MKVLNGQVHIVELITLVIFSFLAFLIGTSLPLAAVILMLFWPLLLIQMLFEGAIILLVNWWRGMRAPQGPPRPPRTGIARYLWLAPLIAVTLGYAVYVITNGKWFI